MNNTVTRKHHEPQRTCNSMECGAMWLCTLGEQKDTEILPHFSLRKSKYYSMLLFEQATVAANHFKQ